MIANLVDQVRGAVCALSFQAPNQSRPVHINRLSWFISRTSPEINTGASLRMLQSVREIQEVPGGYWIPTPTRFVHLESHDLLVSTLPNSEVTRRWNVTAHLAGISRTFDLAPAGAQFESLESWIGAPRDTKQWAQTILQNARASLLPANLNINDLDVFVVSGRTSPRWENGKRGIGLIASHELVLCRPKGSDSLNSHFFANCVSGRLVHQASTKFYDRVRLMWGLALLGGHRVKVSTRIEAGVCQFELAQPLPKEELRLLRALASIHRTSRGSTRFAFRREFFSLIHRTLAHLGLDI